MKKVIIYADGASRGNGAKDAIGAYGAIITCGDKKKEISKAFKGVTNNQMELMGVIEALKILKAPCSIKIFSDSKYVCDAFNQNWIEGWKKRGWKTAAKKSVANRELWEELIRLTNIHEATFSWVKGHADNKGNQRADELCNLAIDEYVRKTSEEYSYSDYSEDEFNEICEMHDSEYYKEDSWISAEEAINESILELEPPIIIEENNAPDRYDFMSLVKDILEDVEDGDLDNMKEQLIDTINFMVESEKRMAKVGLRIRRNL